MAETGAKHSTDKGIGEVILKVNDLKMHFPLRQGMLQRRRRHDQGGGWGQLRIARAGSDGLGGRERLRQDDRGTHFAAPL